MLVYRDHVVKTISKFRIQFFDTTRKIHRIHSRSTSCLPPVLLVPWPWKRRTETLSAHDTPLRVDFQSFGGNSDPGKAFGSTADSL